ncbi:ABC transporter permease [Pontiella agarivorans]|uniref:ABC transporter permease n=1 Tax=Pontiella agarivorans TaxID=3038953 RepID=A0ABU5MXM7_9BACT|nr:ABC transporter permease [Pontiella agarivorans]MDZ8118959.1 ABC transporter permease [Pontiella agarivorans]
MKLDLFAIRKSIPAAHYYTLAVLGFLFSILLYTWISHQSWCNPLFVPKPGQIWTAFIGQMQSPELWMDIKSSFYRVTGGFLLATLFALPLGIYMGTFRSVESFFQPQMEFLRYVPVPALVPLVMIFCGIGEWAKIMLIFLGTFFQLVLMIADEVRRIPIDLIQCSQTLGASRGEIIRSVLARAAMPGIFDALRLCNGWAWTYVIVAELVASTEGMGFRIMRFYRFIQTPEIFVYLILLGVIGLLLDYFFRKLNARLFHWADTSKR